MSVAIGLVSAMSKLRPVSKAGGYRHRVKFQELVTGDDGWGGPTESWVDKFTVWAEVMYLSGGELWSARQSNSDVQGKVRIRTNDDIKANWRMVYDGRNLEILTIIPFDAKRTEQHILFKEWVE